MFYFAWMLKRKLQDLTVCCTYRVDFLHQKAHAAKEFRKQYMVLEEIGRGGFGIVYKAVRLADNLPVAVKFIEHKHVREWTLTGNQLIPSEVCHMETCNDINGVVQLVDWFASPKGFLIVMERPSTCMDVFDLVTAYGKLDEDTSRGIFIQVVDAVCAMYSNHGLIHRDIKDENIIVNMETGEVRLVDLGATATCEKARKKEFQGTRSYCPPEWFRQLQYLPLEATCWSLGVLLYILVTGTLPFRNEIQICLGRVKFPTYLTKEICHLIKSCLTTSSGHRATLIQIREHTWMQKDIQTYEESFQHVLDRTLGRDLSDVSPRLPREDRRQADAEYRQVNDVILTEVDDRKTGTEKRRESISTITFDDIPVDPQQPSTSREPIRRMNSRYDNISQSSFADYVSLISLDSTQDPRIVTSSERDLAMDNISTATTATTNIYYSAQELIDGEEESSLSDMAVPVKSASAYNLAARARKRSLIFKSFDRELDTVMEQAPQEHAPLVMTSSNTSSNSGDDVTLREDLAERQSSVPPSTAVHRLSRHRPLKMEYTTMAFYDNSSTKPVLRVS